MNTWDKLTQFEKAEVMKIALDNGIYNLDTIRDAYNEYAQGGSIHIDPSKKGTFTAAASKHNMGVQEFASKVLANKEDYSPAMVKKANFARNASKWHSYRGHLYDGGGYVRENGNPVSFDPVTGNLIDQTTGQIGTLLLPEVKVTAMDPRKPITTGIPREIINVKSRLYENLSPIDYSDLTRVPNAILLNKPDMYHDKMKNMPVLDEIYAQYLGIPEKDRHFNTRLEKSEYRPTQGGENVTYYKLPQKKTYNGRTVIGDYHWYDGSSNTYLDNLVYDATYMNPGTNKQQVNTELGYYTVGRGRDNNGDYVSYYDKWDINPFSGRLQNNPLPKSVKKALSNVNMDFGTPVHIYDRIYLDDYYGTPKEYRGSTYIPEVTVYGKKKALGGHLYDGGGYVREVNNHPVAFDAEGNLVDQVTGGKGHMLLPEVSVTANSDDVARGRAQRWYRDFGIESNDATSVADGRRQNSHLNERGIEGAIKAAAWAKDHPVLNNVGLGLSTIPLAVAAAPAIVGSGELTATALANPYVDAALTSGFGAHGLNHWLNEGIDGWGDAAMTALEVVPLGRLVKPLYRSASNVVNLAYNRLPWTYRIPENPNMAYRRMGPLERDWLMEGNELSTRETNALTEAEEEAARAASKKGRRFSLFKAGAEHGGRKQFAKGQPWKGTTVTHGEEQVLAIPGKDLPWVSGRHFHGPQGDSFGVGDISFEEAPFGSHIDLLTEEGYTGVNPSLLDGSVIYSPFKIFDHNFGYKKLYPKVTTPQITAENAASITPEQWTAAQDAAIAEGDMAEAQRLRDLHFKVSAPTPYISKGVYLPSGSHPTLSQADYYNGNNDLVTLYHSSVDADNLIKEGFDGVEHGLGRTKGEAKGTIFASASPDYAADYSNLYIQKGLSTPDKVGLMELKVPRGAGTYEGNEVRLRPEHIKEITKSAYKKTPWLRWLKTRKTDNSLFNIKSADAVTYDNNGVRIPLGERDNFNLNDIRYGLLPIGIGLTGYGLSQKRLGGRIRLSNGG